MINLQIKQFRSRTRLYQLKTIKKYHLHVIVFYACAFSTNLSKPGANSVLNQ